MEDNNYLTLDTSLFVIPFEYERKGKYFCETLLGMLGDYENEIYGFKMNFEFDKNGNLISDGLEMKQMAIPLKYPYTLILDTIFNNNYKDLLDKSKLTIEHKCPRSKYNRKHKDSP